ncbi:MAG: hypothetical protein R2874_08235 [Desulfobacterales bacterium]
MIRESLLLKHRPWWKAATPGHSHQMLIVGSPEKSENRIYNTMVVIDTDGAIPGKPA